jgi:hypothetical protein
MKVNAGYLNDRFARRCALKLCEKINKGLIYFRDSNPGLRLVGKASQ